MYRWHSINFIPELDIYPTDGNQSVFELTVLGYIFSWVCPLPLPLSFRTPTIGPYWSRTHKEFYFR